MKPGRRHTFFQTDLSGPRRSRHTSASEDSSHARPLAGPGALIAGLNKLLLVAMLLMAAAIPALAEGPSKGTLLLGVSHVARLPWTSSDDRFTYGSFEYRYPLPYERLSVAGSLEFRGGIRYYNVSLHFKVWENKRYVIALESGPGWLNTGREFLGNRLEFRSLAEIQFKLNSRQCLGIDYCHYSNASTGSINPGTESVRFFWAIRL